MNLPIENILFHRTQVWARNKGLLKETEARKYADTRPQLYEMLKGALISKLNRRSLYKIEVDRTRKQNTKW